MTPIDVLNRVENAGGRLVLAGSSLKMQAAVPLPDGLRQAVREHKSEIIKLLSAEKTANDPEPPNCFAGRHIARCSQCGSQNWGCVRTEAEVLLTGEVVESETWDCLDCVAGPPDVPLAPAPRPKPPGMVDSPCPTCGRPDRLFVKGSPHIEGEPDTDVLICGRCGHTASHCGDCRGGNMVTDAVGTYCVDCRRRTDAALLGEK